MIENITKHILSIILANACLLSNSTYCKSISLPSFSVRLFDDGSYKHSTKFVCINI